VETKPGKRENKPGPFLVPYPEGLSFSSMPPRGVLFSVPPCGVLEGMNYDSVFVGNIFSFINDLSMMGEKNYLVSG
jgi:hypothetical protein